MRRPRLFRSLLPLHPWKLCSCFMPRLTVPDHCPSNSDRVYLRRLRLGPIWTCPLPLCRERRNRPNRVRVTLPLTLPQLFPPPLHYSAHHQLAPQRHQLPSPSLPPLPPCFPCLAYCSLLRGGKGGGTLNICPRRRCTISCTYGVSTFSRLFSRPNCPLPP